MLRAMRLQRPGGAVRGIQNIPPGPRVVKGPKDHAADQSQIMFGQRIGQNGGVFGHEADRAQLDPLVAGGGAFAQHQPPVGIAGIAGKFHPPAAGRVSDPNAHFLFSAVQRSSSSIQRRSLADCSAAATTRLTSSPS